jgi:hypothetical protein
MRKYLLVTLFLLLALVSAVQAQEATEEPELPTIEIIRSSTGYNLPVLGEPWINRSTEDAALFVDEADQAQILVTVAFTLNDTEAIRTALSKVLPEPLAEDATPTFENRIGLPNGTWTQQIYESGDTTISALALIRSDRTYVVALIEDSPNYQAKHLAVRTPVAEGAEPDVAAGITFALETLGSDLATAEPDQVITEPLPSGSWHERIYEGDPQSMAMGFQFGAIAYTLTVTGAHSSAAALADAFNTVFLGFFITPANQDYLNLGMAAVVIVFAVLIGSMWARYQSLKKDLQMVDQMSS